MPVIRLRHTDPQGAMFVTDPAVNRILEAGEEFEVDSKDAGKEGSHGLLGQLGTNYELVAKTTPEKKG